MSSDYSTGQYASPPPNLPLDSTHLAPHNLHAGHRNMMGPLVGDRGHIFGYTAAPKCCALYRELKFYSAAYLLTFLNFADSEAEMEMEAEGAEGWETPRREECRLPAVPQLPPAPRKKAAALPPELAGRRREPPEGGFFEPPDLEALFVLAPRGQASCA